MRLATDHSAGARAVTVTCYHCGKRAQLADMVSDLDGPAFEAYYHPHCIKHKWPGAKIPRCPDRDCARCA